MASRSSSQSSGRRARSAQQNTFGSFLGPLEDYCSIPKHLVFREDGMAIHDAMLRALLPHPAIPEVKVAQGNEAKESTSPFRYRPGRISHFIPERDYDTREGEEKKKIHISIHIEPGHDSRSYVALWLPSKKKVLLVFRKTVKLNDQILPDYESSHQYNLKYHEAKYIERHRYDVDGPFDILCRLYYKKLHIHCNGRDGYMETDHYKKEAEYFKEWIKGTMSDDTLDKLNTRNFVQLNLLYPLLSILQGFSSLNDEDPHYYSLELRGSRYRRLEEAVMKQLESANQSNAKRSSGNVGCKENVHSSLGSKRKSTSSATNGSLSGSVENDFEEARKKEALVRSVSSEEAKERSSNGWVKT